MRIRRAGMQQVLYLSPDTWLVMDDNRSLHKKVEGTVVDFLISVKSSIGAFGQLTADRYCLRVTDWERCSVVEGSCKSAW